MTKTRSATAWGAALAVLVLPGCATPARHPTLQPTATAAAPTVARLVTTADKLGVPYEHFEVGDALGRTITFYVSTPKAKDGSTGLAPLVLFIQGSGCGSVFNRGPDARIQGGLQNMVRDAAKGRARVMVVEKPGVTFLDNPMPPGEATKCSESFNAEQTFDRWAAALSAALRAAAELDGIDRGRVLVMGHSEGSLMAGRVAADNDELVTHVACLSGGGVTQLFDLAQLAWEAETADEPLAARQARMDEIYATWDKIRADPNSTTEFAWGHPYRRWASFFDASLSEQLLRTKAKIYLVHGTADKSTPVEGFDLLRAELSRRGRSFTSERILGADHGYRQAGEQNWDGMRGVFERVLEWFLATE